MTDQQLFILSEDALTAVVDQIQEHQWQMEVPKYVTDKGGTLRTILNYHAYDDAWVPDTLAGKTIAEVGNIYDGDLLGDDPQASWHKIVDKSVQAVNNLQDTSKVVHLSYGDFPAGEYLQHITMFRTMRAIDLARMLGFNDKLKPELIQGMWDVLKPHAEEWRQMGVFGPEVEVAEDADLQSKLLGLTGRQP